MKENISDVQQKKNPVLRSRDRRPKPKENGEAMHKRER